ncbi:TadE/TadG family type IV pilus assembly protein [Spirillospora albida]|uniref:TadE/TadG family type IV pilus assembly protein n=1 Tax=Spirillospora albida TaxID=58123 RepID=UPI00068AC088|nr:TadE family protein [Spirillospora albida]
MNRPATRRLRRRPEFSTAARDSGQVVEFTGMLPLILMVLVLVWEAFLIGWSMTYTTHSANEGARIAAVGGGQAEVEEAARKRVSGRFADDDSFTVKYPTGLQCDGAGPRDPDCGYVRVSIKPPLVLKGFTLPITVSHRAKIVHEGKG